MTGLPIELIVLALGVVLLLVHVGIQGSSVTRERGTEWNAGPRDGEPQPLGVRAGRARRALDNFNETFPAFVAMALALVVSGRSGTVGEIGAGLWLVARIAYLPLYLAGVAYVRSIAWLIAMLGIVLMIVQLFIF
jgi:uncharacterized MAPEG superfamily protein